MIKKVLILDDEEEIASYVAEILERTGNYKAIVVTSPAEAYVRAINQKFELFITDFRMPKTDGLEVITSVQSQKHNKNIPALIMSGFASEVLPQAEGMINVKVLEKPFTDAQLLNAVEDSLAVAASKKVTGKPVLDAALLNHFIQATVHTMNVLAQIQTCVAGKPTLFTREHDLGTVATGMISMNSPKLNGFLAITFPEETLMEFLFRMTGEKFSELNAEAESTTGEIVNIIYGQSRKTANLSGYELKSTMPQVIVGKGHRIWNMNVQAAIMVPFESEMGPFYIIASVY